MNVGSSPNVGTFTDLGFVPNVYRHNLVIIILSALFLTSLSLSAKVQAELVIPDLMKVRIEALAKQDSGDFRIAAQGLIQHYYKKNQYTLAWTRQDQIDDLLRLVEESSGDGLKPTDYHLEHLIELRPLPMANDKALVDYDILLMDAFIRLGSHLLRGKVDPSDMDPDWNFGNIFGSSEPGHMIKEALAAESLYAFVQKTVGRHPIYHRFRKALSQYRDIQDSGGWQPIIDGLTLRIGMRGTRVFQLRNRLIATGDVERGSELESDVFDGNLEQGVIHFQYRHGLDADGIAGKQTIEAMNVTVEHRIDQLLVNMERSRWVLSQFDDDFIVVNIAAFRAYLIRGGEPIWSTRVMVGKPYHATPIFRAKMTYLSFNPTWTIPTSITRRDILPKARKNPNYVKSRGFIVLDFKGNEIDQDTIDWSNTSHFPYMIRQPAGPDNALGLVKFMFPNSHAVYLHDTPSRQLFSSSSRAFSHGCIRTENPMELAEILLNDDEKWNQQSIQKLVESGVTTDVGLPQGLSVLLLYWTAFVEPDGRIFFFNDVYKRDKRLLDALNRDDFLVSLD